MIKNFLEKNKEGIKYLFFGGLTAFLNYFVFYIILLRFGKNQTLIANLISFIIATLFAYTTNRYFVFSSGKNTKYFYGLIKFTFSRIGTFLIEQIGLFITLRITSDTNIIMMSKIIFSFISVLLNYIVAKRHIFKDGENESINDSTSL